MLFSQTAEDVLIPNIENNHRVIFEKPPLPALTDSYTVVDLHFHSHYSDGFNSIDSIACRARRLGIGIAITDHNAIEGAVEMAKHKDILSIPGIEITSLEGAHVLAYFYTIGDLTDFYKTELAPRLGKNLMASCTMEIESVVLSIRKHRGVVVFPHPYGVVFTGLCNPIIGGYRREALLKMADGVEVINSGNTHRWNLKSTVLGFNSNAGLTAGSDGHNLFQMGSAVTYAACGKDTGSFLDALIDKKTWTIGKEVGLLRKMTSSGLKIRTNINNAPNLLGKNVRYSCALIHSGSNKVRNHVYRTLEGRRKPKLLF